VWHSGYKKKVPMVQSVQGPPNDKLTKKAMERSVVSSFVCFNDGTCNGNPAGLEPAGWWFFPNPRERTSGRTRVGMENGGKMPGTGRAKHYFYVSVQQHPW
jgi:hypothetical protein